MAWGLVATFQNFITNYAGYLVTRIMLGLCEAGFIPGSLYTLSTWYKRDETSLRVSLFFLGNLLSTALTSLIGAGILSMGDRYGVPGWRWLFIGTSLPDPCPLPLPAKPDCVSPASLAPDD